MSRPSTGTPACPRLSPRRRPRRRRPCARQCRRPRGRCSRRGRRRGSDRRWRLRRVGLARLPRVRAISSSRRARWRRAGRSEFRFGFMIDGAQDAREMNIAAIMRDDRAAARSPASGAALRRCRQGLARRVAGVQLCGARTPAVGADGAGRTRLAVEIPPPIRPRLALRWRVPETALAPDSRSG